MEEQYDPPRFRFGFALSGLLSAGLAYLAFDAGLFSGPAWQGFLAAVLIGSVSAVSLLLLEKAVLGRSGRRAGEWKPVRIKGGDWGCPRCGSAYRRSASICTDCNVPLVEAEPRR